MGYYKKKYYNYQYNYNTSHAREDNNATVSLHSSSDMLSSRLFEEPRSSDAPAKYEPLGQRKFDVKHAYTTARAASAPSRSVHPAPIASSSSTSTPDEGRHDVEDALSASKK